jgi:hypothetical protein
MRRDFHPHEILLSLGSKPSASGCFATHRSHLHPQSVNVYVMKNKVFQVPENEFIQIVRLSFSVAEVCRKCGIPSTYGSYYSCIYKRIQQLNLSTSHFNGKSSDISPKPYKNIFVKNHTISSNSYLKQRYIEKIKPKYECSICKISTWNKKKITLQLDHINGDRLDNQIQNLRLLCPNCHSQTKTFCAVSKQKIYHTSMKVHYCQCGKARDPRAQRCKLCEGKRRFGLNTKIQWPSDDKLQTLIQTLPMLQVAKQLKVSFNAVKKRCLKRDLR